MVTVASFRADFPEFADATRYPDTRVQFWLTLAYKRLNVVRWADLLDYGVELFTAHNLALAPRLGAGGSAGAPGLTTGLQTSKSVGSVSVSYDVSTGVVEGGGNWNLTAYGVQWLQLAGIVGAGPLQVGTPGDLAGVVVY